SASPLRHLKTISHLVVPCRCISARRRANLNPCLVWFPSGPMQKDPSSLVDQWFVTNGVVALGPVEFDRLASGVAHGRIPATSFVRHQSWKVWRELSEIEGLSAVDRLETVRRLAGISSGAEERAADPRSYPPPPLEIAPTAFDSRTDSHP